MSKQRICDFCLGVQSGAKWRCPVCGRMLVHCLPTRDEIYRDAAAIRKRWTIHKLRDQEDYQEASIPEVHRGGDRMRRREMEDGGET